MPKHTQTPNHQSTNHSDQNTNPSVSQNHAQSSDIFRQLAEADRRRLGSRLMTPNNVLLLQRTLGNQAVMRKLGIAPLRRPAIVQRAEDAHTVAEGLGVSNHGPLNALVHELAGGGLNHAQILKQIGRLGPGERAIVAHAETNTGIMQQLADTLTADEMYKAIRLLQSDQLDADFQLTWAIRWMGRVPGGDAYMTTAKLEQLILPASKEALEDLLNGPLQAILLNYTGNPIHLLELKLDSDEIINLIRINQDIAGWLLCQNPISAQYALRRWGGDDPSEFLTTLQQSARFDDFMDSLPRGSGLTAEDKQILSAMFTAGTGEQRIKIFTVRFDKQAPPVLLWDQPQILGYWQQSQTDESDDATENLPDGQTLYAQFMQATMANRPAAQLVEMLSQLSPAEIVNVVADGPTLIRLGRSVRGNPNTAHRMLEHLNFNDPIKTMDFIHMANMDNGVGLEPSIFREMVYGADQPALRRLFANAAHLTTLRNLNLINPLMVRSITGDGATFGAYLTLYPDVANWVVEATDAESLVQYIGEHATAEIIAALTDAHWDQILNNLPTGIALTPSIQDALFVIFQNTNAMDFKKKLMKKRFNLDYIQDDGSGAPDWEEDGLERMWELFNRLPAAHVADNDWLQGVLRTGNAPDPNTSGVTGNLMDNPVPGQPRVRAVGMNYDPNDLDVLDAGHFTGANDVLRGEKVFDAIAIHEIGHAADFQNQFSGAGSPLLTDANLGAWREYKPTSTTAQANNLYNALEADSNGENGMDADEAEYTNKTLVRAIKRRETTGTAATHIRNTDPVISASVGNQNWFSNFYLNTILPLDMTQIIRNYGNQANAPWNQSFNDAINNRAYHESYPNEWVSYDIGARNNGPGAAHDKISKYQFRDHGEYFGEVYATFYLTPNDPGALLRNDFPALYDWMVEHVDKGHSTRYRP